MNIVVLPALLKLQTLENLIVIAYADDITLLSDDPRVIGMALDIIAQAVEESGLQINMDKTCWWTTHAGSMPPVTDFKITEANYFKVLGTIVERKTSSRGLDYFNQKVTNLKMRIKRISMLPGGLWRRTRFIEAHTTLVTYAASHIPANSAKKLERMTSNVLEAAYAKPATTLARRANEIIFTLLIPAHRVLTESAVQYQSLVQMVRRVFKDSSDNGSDSSENNIDNSNSSENSKALAEFNASLIAATGDSPAQMPKQTAKIAEALRHFNLLRHGRTMVMEKSRRQFNVTKYCDNDDNATVKQKVRPSAISSERHCARKCGQS